MTAANEDVTMPEQSSTTTTTSNVIPPAAPQPVQPTQSVYFAIASPYVIQLIALVGVMVYFIVHDNVDANVFFGFVQILIGFNAAGGALQGATHLIANASIQRTAIHAGETVVTKKVGE